jgi:hypothetical protein
MIRSFVLPMLAMLLFVPAGWTQQVLLLDDVSDVTIYGADEFGNLGWHLESLGDVNADGSGEILAINEVNSSHGVEWAGFLVYGGKAIPATVDLREASTEVGIVFQGADRVGSVGDFNADGFNDYAVSDVGYDLEPVYDVGFAFIGFGTESLPSVIDVSGINMPGIKVMGHRSAEWVGNRIRQAGDFNGDGFGDVLIQGWQSRSSNIREMIVLFGGEDLPQELSTGNLGEHGVILTSAFPLDLLGDSFAPVGDVNGDGLDDILIGADAGTSGEDYAYLVYGSRDFPALLSVDQLGSRGLTIKGGQDNFFPSDVSGAGDINGDGYADLITAWPGSSPNGLQYAGEVYLVFGAPDLPASMSIDDIRENGIVIQGVEAQLKFGVHVLGGLNLNGDGYPDLVVVPGILQLIDDIYVLPGGPELSRPGTYRLDALHPIILRSLSGGINYPNVIRSGDIDGDGYDDILIGHEYGRMPLPGGGKRDACGAVFVVHGGPERFASLRQRADLNGDGEVDHEDLFLLGSRWLEEE